MMTAACMYYLSAVIYICRTFRGYRATMQLTGSRLLVPCAMHMLAGERKPTAWNLGRRRSMLHIWCHCYDISNNSFCSHRYGVHYYEETIAESDLQLWRSSMEECLHALRIPDKNVYIPYSLLESDNSTIILCRPCRSFLHICVRLFMAL